ncbi:putative tRNA (uracil-5-)-methyltransferase like protein [Cricetulus griseus]|uniref:Putative tRNA (Uracil-5-)-methyltransferase like protein n=1 Tax=Cricetulus griseus TaxID=10029 RepID=A0A061ID34_CRIGR|nr:putative tRNA (uracil-5-)-methyltransferase like protein [Cricetulus griseus]
MLCQTIGELSGVNSNSIFLDICCGTASVVVYIKKRLDKGEYKQTLVLSCPGSNETAWTVIGKCAQRINDCCPPRGGEDTPQEDWRPKDAWNLLS